MHFVNAKTILSQQNGMNTYRGCTHGCIYCDSRSLCYHFTHEFTDIEVKQNAPELLENALRSKKKKCMIGTGSMCDPYLHAEKELRITRRCIEIVKEYGFGLDILTKSNLIMRDMDLLEAINNETKCVVQMTLTTCDEDLCRIIEPNVCTTKERVKVLEECGKRGIPTVVWLCPILPFISDTEENIRGLLDICVKCGVKGIVFFGVGLTLRDGDREYFYEALDKHFPGLKERYIKTYGNSYEVTSPDSARLSRIVYEECRKHNIMSDMNRVFGYLKEFPEKYEQLSLL